MLGSSEVKFAPIVNQAMAILINCLQDPVVQVRESATWCIGKQSCSFRYDALFID